jgi:DNA-directed RNA polymerase subunit RPC12/RpoP
MFRRMFIGRNGPDQLSLALTLAACLLSIISSFFRLTVLYYIFFALDTLLFVYAVYRMFSKNIEKRRKENMAFMNLVNRIKMWYYNSKSSMQQRKFYKVFVCPKCGQKLRVPKGKGKVAIKCSKCGNRILKNT